VTKVQDMLQEHRPTVSVIIKALNEEPRIAAAIESAIAGLAGIDGEIILADGGSRDRTVEIARQYPITIVQLNNPADRSCGSGAQLGFQYSRGRYLLLMDGDMRLHKEFLPAAVRFLDHNTTVGGVGGHVLECETANLEYEQRQRRYDPDRGVGPVTRLASSGLYRRTAIDSVGYVTDRNLHGNEEFDLGARLHTCGWSLARIDCAAVDHHGHTGNAYQLLLRRVKNRNAWAMGELFRAAVGRPHFSFLVRKDHNGLLCLTVTGWWLALALTPFVLSGWTAALATAAVFLLPFVAMSLRWRSIWLALYSVTAWNVFTSCSWLGLLRPRRSPTDWIDSTVLKDSAHPQEAPDDRSVADIAPALTRLP
jgi:glycosyltransferase involved in cell wall biosynthesis